jgi:hypothetical protein
MDSKKTKVKGVRFPNELLDAIWARARRQHKFFNQCVVESLKRDFLRRR